MGVAALAPIGLGLQTASAGLAAYGEAKGQTAAAQQAVNAAAAARAAADQTDTQLREELRGTLGNIDAIRAAANTDPFSPTAMAVKDEERRVSTRERRIRGANARAQASAYDDTARLNMFGANAALLGGGLKVGMGLTSMARSMP